MGTCFEHETKVFQQNMNNLKDLREAITNTIKSMIKIAPFCRV